MIAGRAHQTLRFEDLEQKTVIPISDPDVRREYFKETGGADTGLVVLDSLNLWRQRGWRVGRKRYVELPGAAIPQFQAGQPWTVVKGPQGRPDPDLGHYVYICGYNKTGPVCVTWGSKQQMTWQWYDKYVDEAYCIIDAKDLKALTKALDLGRLGTALESVTRVTQRH